jgi:F-type H+-transporting ATPase subunit delta
MVTALATHYARALADAVTDPKSDLTPAQAMDQLRLVTDTLKSSPDLARCLLSPSVARAKKEAVVSTLASQLGTHRLIQNFLRLIVHHRRVGDLGGIQGEFEKIIDERTGFQRADIVSAVNLADSQKQEIVSVLERASGKQIRPFFKTDPSILGGVIARLISKEYDGSLKGRLESLRQRLKTAS